MGSPATRDEIWLEKNDRAVLKELLEESSFELTDRLREVFGLMIEQSISGNSLRILPAQEELSSQKAAEILRVSRMYLIKLLDEKKTIPFRKVGKHRRILVSDLMCYKTRLDSERDQALQDLADLGQDIDEEY